MREWTLWSGRAAKEVCCHGGETRERLGRSLTSCSNYALPVKAEIYFVFLCDHLPQVPSCWFQNKLEGKLCHLLLRMSNSLMDKSQLFVQSIENKLCRKLSWLGI